MDFSYSFVFINISQNIDSLYIFFYVQYVHGTLPHPATRPSKTHSMAVRAIPLSACHHGPPNGYRTGFKKCSVVDDINAKAVEA